jgi:hypothetical protein
MITLAELEMQERRKMAWINGQRVVVEDYWDGDGTGMCTHDPVMVRVRYPDGRVCDEENDDRVSLHA